MLKLSDIATHAGVSPTTVSFVLNDRPEAERISEKTRQKVRQAAEELGYRSNQWARAMRTGNSRMLGLIGGRTGEEQVGQMLEGALEAADAQGFTLKILRLDSIGNSAQQVIRRSSELRLMGIVALHLPDSILQDLHIEADKYDTPLVVMDAICDDEAIAQVVSDDFGGIAQGVEHLAQLGHSKIAFICGGDRPEVLTPRKAAFRAAMERFQVAINPNYIKDGHFREREKSAQAARELLSLPVESRPTAIFCSGDLIALATLQVASELGIKVPSELSVLGFANLTPAEFATPPLTTIEQPFAEMGRTAVNMLLSIVSERTHDEDGQTKKPATPPAPKPASAIVNVLPTRLIERASTAPPA